MSGRTMRLEELLAGVQRHLEAARLHEQADEALGGALAEDSDAMTPDEANHAHLVYEDGAKLHEAAHTATHLASECLAWAFEARRPFPILCDADALAVVCERHRVCAQHHHRAALALMATHVAQSFREADYVA